MYFKLSLFADIAYSSPNNVAFIGNDALREQFEVVYFTMSISIYICLQIVCHDNSLILESALPTLNLRCWAKIAGCH